MLTFLLLGIFVVIVIILFVPLTFWGRGSIAETMSGEIGLDWAGGLIAARWLMNQPEKKQYILRIGPWEKPGARARTEPDPSPSHTECGDPPPNQSSEHSSDKYSFKLSSIKPFLNKYVFKESLHFLRQIWKSLKLRFDLTGEYGTEDPALTGMLAAGISALCGANCCMSLQSNFECNALDLQGELRGRIVPALLMWECGRFIFRAPIRRIWWPMLTKRIIRNEGGV